MNIDSSQVHTAICPVCHTSHSGPPCPPRNMIDWESFATDLVRDHARLTVPGYAEYERLQKAREEYLTRGHQLMRMSRQCSLEANICYDEAQLIEHQMRGIK